MSSFFGTYSGNAKTFTCPTGSHIAQLNMRNGNWIDSIQATCNDGTIGDAHGGNGGSASDPIFSSSGFNGVGGGYYKDGNGFSHASAMYFTTPDSKSPSYGQGQYDHYYGCPDGQTLNGFTTTGGTDIASISFTCAAPQLSSADSTADSTASQAAPAAAAPSAIVFVFIFLVLLIVAGVVFLVVKFAPKRRAGK